MTFRYTFALIILLCNGNLCYEKTNNIIGYTTGLKRPNNLHNNIGEKSVNIISNIPLEWDWRNIIGNIGIRNQGGCGSCWAFATIGPIEFIIKNKTGQEFDLSEQFLVSCNRQGFNCASGGWWAFDDFKSDGFMTESCFPYVGRDIPCKQCQPINFIKLINWGYVDVNEGIPSVDRLKSAIIQYGPITVGISVSNNFYGYRSGVFDYNSPYGINHGVVILGWDDNKESWIIRNSWGTGWGMGGHMFIKYGCSSVGDGAAYVNIDVQNGFYINSSPKSPSPCDYNINPIPNVSPKISFSQSPTQINSPSVSPYRNTNPCSSSNIYPSYSKSSSSSPSPYYHVYNDQCNTALLISCGQYKYGTTMRTKQSNILNCIAAPSSGLGIWFYIDIYDDISTLEINTFRSNYDTQLSLYRGQCNNLMCVGKNDDYNNLRTSRILLINPTIDRYYIVAHGYGAIVGFVNISVIC